MYTRLRLPTLSAAIFREEAEAKAKKERYAQLTAEGKTDQAKADLARLARIRKEREDAEKRRQQEQKGTP